MTQYVVVRGFYIYGPMTFRDAQAFISVWGGMAKPLVDATCVIPKTVVE